MGALVIFSYASIVIAILLLFTPMHQVWHIWKKGHLDNQSITFATVGAVKCAFWARYGHLVKDNSIIVGSAIGIFVYSFYVVFFVYYTVEKSRLLLQVIVCLTVVALMVVYVESAPSDTMTALGFAAMLLSVFSFAAPLTQLHRIVIERAIRNRLPLLYIGMTFVSAVLRLVYGLLIANAFIAVPNGIGVLIAAGELVLFLIYPSRQGGRSFLARHFKCFRPLTATY